MVLKKIVITGGPCTGKTTTIEALRKKGFAIIEETARFLIEEQLRIGGEIVPWKNILLFNEKVAHFQLTKEMALTEGTFFLDRGIVDNLAYCRWGNIEPPAPLLDAVKQLRYEKVFFLQKLPLFENDPVRRENLEEQERLHLLIRDMYLQHGYPLIEVPPFPVEERVEFILRHVNGNGE